jgi:hypothetical protein
MKKELKSPILGGKFTKRSGNQFYIRFQYSEGTIQGSNARCLALLHTMKKVINEFETPDGKEFSRELVRKRRPVLKKLRRRSSSRICSFAQCVEGFS